MTLVNRYNQLLVSVPRGTFYSSDGQILPFKNIKQSLQINVGVESSIFNIFVNGNFVGTVNTDVDGIASISVKLDLGFNEIKLESSSTGTKKFTYITTRNSATFMAAHAEVIQSLDIGTEQLLEDSRLSTSSAGMIETVFGSVVSSPNNMLYDLETYREMLQELRTAYRYYGGTIEGLSRAVRAVTQISPILYPRSFGPTWILDKDLIYPKTDVASHTYWSDPNFITLSGSSTLSISCGPDTGVGSGELEYDGTTSPKTLRWKAPNGAYGNKVNISTTEDKAYTLHTSSYDTKAAIGTPGPYNIIAGANDKLLIDINNIGTLEVTLTPGAARTAAQIATDINGAAFADWRYLSSFPIAGTFTNCGETRITLTRPVAGSVNRKFTIHPVFGSSDAAQTLFDLPIIRGGLDGNHFIGDTILQLSGSTDMSNWFNYDSTGIDESLTIGIGRTTFQPVGSTNAAASTGTYKTAEVVKIDISSQQITIKSPGLQADQFDGTLVELVGQMPAALPITENVKSISVAVGNSSTLPSFVATQALTISGTALPDGWILTDSSYSPVSAPEPFYMYNNDLSRDLPIRLASDRVLYIPIPDEVLEYKGFMLDFDIYAAPYLYQTGGTAYTEFVNYTIGDADGTWDSGLLSFNGNVVTSTNSPQRYYFECKIPYYATKSVYVTITTTNGGEDVDMLLHKVRATIRDPDSGLYLGSGTMPRSEHEIKNGNFLFLWSKDELTNNEKSLLGITDVSQSQIGHIDNIVPDNIYLSKFDVTTYTSHVPDNVKGLFSDTDFSSGTRTNMSIVARTPSRFSYLLPSTVSEHTETITWDALTNTYTLEFESDQIVNNTIVFEDGIPMESTDWTFTSGTIIHKATAPNPGAIYVVVYNAKIEFVSTVIDLGANYADYVWYADYDVWLRPEMLSYDYPINTGVTFDEAGVAILPEVNNGDQTLATLTENSGTVTNIIPISKWSFTGQNTIEIDNDILNLNNLYHISYISNITSPKDSASIIVEHRSGTTGPLVTTYETVKQNQVVNSAHRYHQFKMTLNNVRDVRDARIKSVLLKGLNMFGTGGTVPILR